LKQQLRYALEDILDHKLNHFILFVQILAALLLLSFIFYIVLDINSYKNKLNEIMQSQEEEIYLTNNISSSEKVDEILLGGQNSMKRQGELYEFIKQNPSFKTYTADTCHSMWLSDSNLDDSFTKHPGYTPGMYFLLKIDQKFLSVFKLKCVKGKMFSTDDFKDTGSEIPLLLGYDFQKYYDLDDIIYGDEGHSYRVIGFLEKSSFYLDPLRGDIIFWLDKAFVVPVQPDKFGDDTTYYESALSSTFIITDDTENLQKIQKKSNELDLYTYEYRSFTKQLQYLLEATRFKVMITGFMMAIILIFSSIGLISNLVHFITTHTKEFAIHLLCGGQVKSIIQRILIQTFLIILIADIIVIIIHKFSPVTLLTVISSLVIGLIITVYPAIMLSKTEINNILKRSQ
jgi:ABC-type antimicrobial peptide transport system permease subunit